MKFEANNFIRMEVMMAMFLIFCKSINGDNSIKLHYRVLSFGQNVALVMVDRVVKFEENSLHFVNFMADIC